MLLQDGASSFPPGRGTVSAARRNSREHLRRAGNEMESVILLGLTLSCGQEAWPLPDCFPVKTPLECM